jgi:hypothetical protein
MLSCGTENNLITAEDERLARIFKKGHISITSQRWAKYVVIIII